MLSSDLHSESSQRESARFLSANDTLNRIKDLEQNFTSCYSNGEEYKAIKIASELCELKRAHYGQLSEEYLSQLLTLSDIYAERIRPRKSFKIHNLAYLPYMQMLRNNFSKLSIEDRQDYWETASSYISKTMNISFKTASPFRIDDSSLMAEAAYNATLLYKGILLNLTKDADVKDIPQLRITIDDVRSSLGFDDLAIEFFRTTTGHYGAILMKREWEKPKLIRLGNGRRHMLDRFLLESTEAQSIKGNNNRRILKRTSKKIWTSKLLQYFPTDKKGIIYFSADGEMLQSGIEYLPFASKAPGGDYYTMSDAFNLVRLSSTRELAIHKDEIMIDSAALFGGIDYGTGKETISANKHNDRSSVITLAGAYKEVKDIKKQLDSIGIGVRLRTGSKADKESYFELNGKPYNVIHIATHGFYKTLKQQPDTEDPLKRCGLVFASRGDDCISNGSGLLTAAEISRTNLINNDLVILSACETALGDMTQDGVFGLQRGFKMAGAGTIIMSLWKVNDKTTQELMSLFYSHWLTSKCSKRYAFQKAINEIREKYKDPAFWAAFIMLD